MAIETAAFIIGSLIAAGAQGIGAAVNAKQQRRATEKAAEFENQRASEDRALQRELMSENRRMDFLDRERTARQDKRADVINAINLRKDRISDFEKRVNKSTELKNRILKLRGL